MEQNLPDELHCRLHIGSPEKYPAETYKMEGNQDAEGRHDKLSDRIAILRFRRKNLEIKFMDSKCYSMHCPPQYKAETGSMP